MTTDRKYSQFAKRVYDVDSKKKKVPLKKGGSIFNKKYRVLEVEDSPDNGMQAMVSKRNRNILVLNYKLRRFYDSKKESHHFIRNGSNFSNGRYSNV
ncbi:TPA: hypothetical protein TT554_000311 [Streptococcus equi subsp. zooepidemicus]|nr:hypothetical protein [Streptococcus equi subsp. zooepidemicus]